MQTARASLRSGHGCCARGAVAGSVYYNSTQFDPGSHAMRLIEELERRVAQEQSLFRAQLLREDIARLKKLQELARTANDLAGYKKASLRIGWTQGDLRTHELRAPLEVLLDAVFAYETGTSGNEQETRIVDAWLELHRTRMERLVGCLSTPVPKPTDGA